MKKLFLTLIILSILIVSCHKNKNIIYKYRYNGYIFNKNDSTPYVNTKFKVYYYRLQTNKTEEEFFYTDSAGKFDVTTNITFGEIVWPSFFYGAGYIGPPIFGGPKSYTQDNNIFTNFYDTLYTTPFY